MNMETQTAPRGLTPSLLSEILNTFVGLISLFVKSLQTTGISKQQLCTQKMKINISLSIPHISGIS